MKGQSLFLVIFPLCFLGVHAVFLEYYVLLDVDQNATTEEIHDAFRRIGEHTNGKKDPDLELSDQRILRAYWVLGNEDRRIHYDTYGDDYYLTIDMRRDSSRQEILETSKKLRKNFEEGTKGPLEKCAFRETEKALFILANDEMRKYYDINGEDYYSILSAERKASQNDISRAFRDVASLYHPDKTKCLDAERKFLEAQKAYFILGDEQRRTVYDVYGEQGLKVYDNYEDSLLFSKFVLSTTKYIKDFTTRVGIDRVVHFVLTPVKWVLQSVASMIGLSMSYVLNQIT